MKKRPLLMVFLLITAFAQVLFAETADDAKKKDKDLGDQLMRASTLSKIKLLDQKSNFVDPETRRKFETAFPAKDFAGKPYAYTGLCVTLPELQSMLKDGVVKSPGALVERPNEAVSMVYDQTQKKADAFPVIVQVKAEDVQGSGPIKPESITGVTLFYKDGFLADAKRPDPGAAAEDAYIGTPVLRLATVPDDSAGQSIADVQRDLVSTAGGAAKAVHAKEAPAPGSDSGIPQYTVKVLAGESVVNVAPADGNAFKPFDLTGGEVNIAVITNKGVETGTNPVLNAETLDNSSKFNVVVLAISGALVIDSPFFPKPILLKPEDSNYYTDDSGGASVGTQPEYQNRDESTTAPIIVDPDARARQGGGDSAGDIAAEADKNPATPTNGG